MRKPLVLLGGILVAAFLVIAYLIFRTRPTVVEVHVTLDHVLLDLLPSGSADGSEASSTASALSEVKPLAESLATPSLAVVRADRVEASGGGRQLWLRPRPRIDGGGIDLQAGVGPRPAREPGADPCAPGPDGASAPLQPQLTLHGPIRAEIESVPRPCGAARVVMDLEPRAPAGKELPFLLEVSHDGYTLDLDGAQAFAGPADTRPRRIGRARYAIPAESPQLVAQGAARGGRLSMTIQPEMEPGSLMRVVDPLSGEVSEKRWIEVSLPEPRLLAWNDHVVALEPALGAGVTPLLRPGLAVRDLEFWRPAKREPESFLAGGSIRFPLGEKETIDIEPGFFLSLEAEQPLTLRSLGVAGGRLEMVLWGRPSRVRLGPTPGLQAERLPNLFVWLYTHSLGTLIYSTLVGIAGISLAAFRLLGLFKDDKEKT